MHYLNDYLELLEPLRETVREKLTAMREKDLQLQVDFAQLEDDSSEFLSGYRLYQRQSSLSPSKSRIQTRQPAVPSNDQPVELTPDQLGAQQQKQTEYDRLVDRHQQLLQMTTAKVTLANESHEVVERYYKKLENDLHKFKLELEADYSGVTEMLERRFANEACNEYDDKLPDNSVLDSSLLDIEPFFDPFNDLAMSKSLIDDYNDQLPLNYLSAQTHRLSTDMSSYTSSLSVNRKSHQRPHSSATSRGRKRRQSASSANHSDKRKRNLLSGSHQDESDEVSIGHYLHAKNACFDDDTYTHFDPTDVLASLNGQTEETADERRYCFCNQISYGDMIACDSPTCRREWFHYPCVGIVTPPKGKWFCMECTPVLQQAVIEK